MTEIALIALGSNLGDREQHLRTALRSIAALSGSRILAVTAVEETEPLGARDQPPYLNQMAALETELAPQRLLGALQGIERDAGRVRDERWASRTLDLDIVLYGNVELAESGLQIPHPGLASRDFWQREVADLKAQLSTPSDS